MSGSGFVTRAEIEQARTLLKDRIRRTPVEPSPSLSNLSGVPVSLKLEHHQFSGSFKFRGATNAVLSLSAAEREAGVVGVSTGNHGRGLARAAAAAGVRCVIAMSELVPGNKVEGIRAEGADVLIHGRSQDEAQTKVDDLVAAGMTMIPPFDDRRIIAGQGTLGLEIIEAMPDLATVVVQVSGGGLISGIAAAIKAVKPHVRIVGVSMERGAAMHASLEAGHPVEVEELSTLADSLGGGIGLGNQLTYAMTRDLVDDVVTLTEPEIAAGIRHCYWQERQIVEGSGAVGVAALLSGKIEPSGPTMLLLSGGNIDMTLHHRIASGEDVDLAREAA
ncbi:MAG: hydroxyectoine utilization dehydratase EutB [Paracoccaceae bacterium]